MQGDSWRPARGRRPDRHSRRAARCPHGTHKPCGPARGSGPESDSTWATHDSSATRRHLRRVPKRGALTARRLNILWPQSAPTRRPRVRAAVRVDCGLPPERRATPSWRSTLCGWPLKTPGPYAPTDRTLVTALRAYGPSAPNRRAEPPSPRSAIAPVVRRTGRRARRPAPTSRVCGGACRERRVDRLVSRAADQPTVGTAQTGRHRLTEGVAVASSTETGAGHQPLIVGRDVSRETTLESSPQPLSTGTASSPHKHVSTASHACG